jgi:hypothetical protein
MCKHIYIYLFTTINSIISKPIMCEINRENIWTEHTQIWLMLFMKTWIQISASACCDHITYIWTHQAYTYPVGFRSELSTQLYRTVLQGHHLHPGFQGENLLLYLCDTRMLYVVTCVPYRLVKRQTEVHTQVENDDCFGIHLISRRLISNRPWFKANSHGWLPKL